MDNAGKRPGLFVRSNIRMISGLSIMLVLLIINGAIGLYSWNRSQSLVNFYFAAALETRGIQAVFLMQVRSWKNMLLSREYPDDYRKHHYHFSRYSSQIGDSLFNLKMKMHDYGRIASRVQNLRDIHGALSAEYLSQSVVLERPKYDSIDPALVLRDSEEKAIGRIDEVVADIMDLSNEEVGKINGYFISMIALTFILLIVLSMVLMARIILNNRETQGKIMEIAGRLNSYLPHQLVDSIMTNGAIKPAGIERRYVTVCFTDIQGFTALAEKLEPGTTAGILNEYLADMTAITHKWGGMVDKFIGDGIMILFGAFSDDDRCEQALRAVRMAAEMQDHMERLKERWKRDYKVREIGLRIGIGSGIANVGSFGPDARRDYTAIGSVVNIASRIEKICPRGGVLLSDATRRCIGDAVPCRSIGMCNVKGIDAPQELFKLTCCDESGQFVETQIESVRG